MKKNFILVAILLAVGVANASFFLSERENSAELRIDNLEMLAEGEDYDKWGLFWDTKIKQCEQPNGDVINKSKCCRGWGIYCEDEDCPKGTVVIK